MHFNGPLEDNHNNELGHTEEDQTSNTLRRNRNSTLRYSLRKSNREKKVKFNSIPLWHQGYQIQYKQLSLTHYLQN